MYCTKTTDVEAALVSNAGQYLFLGRVSAGPCQQQACRMSYGDEGYVVGDEQQYSDDQLQSIKGSVIRHGPLRCALIERKNKLDVEKPGERAAKRCRHRVDKRIQDGVPMSKSGSGLVEFVAVSSCAAKGRKSKLKPTQSIKCMTARD